MIEADFFAEVEPLNRVLREFGARVGKAMPELVRQSGRTLCRTLADETQPHGDFSSGRRKGQMAALSDVYHVYVSPQTMYWKIKNARLVNGSQGTPEGVAKAFLVAMTHGDTEKAQRILERSGIDGRLRLNRAKIGAFDGGAEHRRRRSSSTGRVQGVVPSMILTDDKGLKKYQENLERGRVGRAKGAWADCSRQLGSTRGFPAWLVKVGAGTGRVEERMDRGEPVVVLQALPSYMSRVISGGSIGRAAHFAAGKMRKMVEKVLDYEARRANA